MPRGSLRTVADASKIRSYANDISAPCFVKAVGRVTGWDAPKNPLTAARIQSNVQPISVMQRSG
jgi:hypothetical protein